MRAEKGIARHTTGMNSYRQQPSNFSLVRFEHAHASYPGLSFRPSGFGKKESSGTGLGIAVLVTGFTLVNTRE